MTSLTDTQVVTASGGLVELGYAEKTSNTTITSTSPTSPTATGLSVTVVSDGSPMTVEFYCGEATPPNVNNGVMLAALWVDGAEYDRTMGVIYNYSDGVNSGRTIYAKKRITLAAGSHTIDIRGWIANNAGLSGYYFAGTNVSGFSPAYIRVSKIVQATQWPAVTTGTIICTSTTRPASPFEGQRIYETDTNKEWVYDGAAWYTPGLQGYATVTGNQTGLHTLTNLTNASITFTAVAGRQYEVTGQCLFFASGGDMYQQLLFRDGTTVIGISVSALIQNSSLATVCLSRIATFSAGSHTIYLSTQRQAGTGSAYTSIDPVRPDFIAIKDIGPA